ncbi:YncE family protein [Moheibacter stercoris]|uniref:YVTN family beta-propeller protein n=1 Tax=Moheibacter stercoris TaxID=1628251 RepID=A0ABV2LPU9_9FLAO
MNRLNQILLAGITVSSVFFTSCSSDDDSSSNNPILGDFENGVFILNEGNMGSSNASVSFLHENGQLQNDIFEAVNGGLLGDTAQSIYLDDDKAYIILSGSGTIEVVDADTFQKLGTVSTGLASPRYMVIENGKGFVSNWGNPADANDDFIAVINLSNYSVESTIPVAEGPEKLEETNGKIYVAHAGGWGTGNTITVINSATNSVQTTIPVGDIPNSIEEENGKIYVLCGGKPAWTQDETLGGLYVINSTNHQVETVLNFAPAEHPANLVEENDQLFYTIDDKIFRTNLTSTTLPSSPIITMGTNGIYGAYGFDVNDGKIYVGDAMDYSSNGKVHVFSTSGALLNSYEVGKLPNGFAFND